MYEKYDQIHPMQEWRYDLKVRYVPRDLNDLYERDRVTFYYYYDQVRIVVCRVKSGLIEIFNILNRPHDFIR